MKKITSFTHHTTAEGERVTFTFSEIDEETGQLLKSNERQTMIILGEKELKAIETLNAFLLSKVE